GTLEQVNSYYPGGMPMLTEVVYGDAQPYKYTGKELERQHGLNQYDFGARWYDPARPGTTTMDPLCERRPWESPYLWCAGNPVKNIDPTGMVIIASQPQAQQAIRNTISLAERKYVKFNTKGVLDTDLLLSNNSKSENYNNLVVMSIVPDVVSVEMATQYQYKDNNGFLKRKDMSYYIDETMKSAEITSAFDTSSGEFGLTGVTLLPGNGNSGVNTYDDNIHIILNSNLSETGAAENFSHEGYGHALMYLLTHDRTMSGHQYDGMMEMNKRLYDQILKSLRETHNNMSNK
ncbi:MAG: hypothetical protein IJ632_04165, partial [Muribaculaceae bacterium]|nr:hypothetical protein [Muribaculaceae bacterium]